MRQRSGIETMSVAFAEPDIQISSASTPLLSSRSERLADPACPYDLSLQDVAHLTGFPERNISHWVARGLLVPNYREGIPYFCRQDVEEILRVVRQHAAPVNEMDDSWPTLGDVSPIASEDYAG
jgi:hypothetical protein